MAQLLRFAQVGSTMDVLHRLAAEGAPAGTAVVAEEQRGGRGSRGRRWASPPGGLWLSVLHRPPGAGGLELLSLRTGLALVSALEESGVPGPLALKWPNDLMLADRKLGGILCEARWHGEVPGWIVIGIGVNVRNPIPPELEAVAINLAGVRPGIDSEALLPPVLAALRGLRPDEGPLSPVELAHYSERDWLLGRTLLAPAEGMAAGVAPDGALLVRDRDGRMTAVQAGTVELAKAPRR